MKRVSRSLLAVVLLGMLLPFVPASTAAQAPATTPEQQLAERYVPIAYLREQPTACATVPQGGEPYLPLPVDMVLDNPDVILRDRATGDELARGLDAVALATYGPDTYLDFPGDPLRPGCVYETDERALIADRGLEPTTYARVIFDETEQRLALQYWFFWYFNDWNNTHEGDWEGIQIMWDDVSSVEQALGMPPTRVGFAQHGGGELADWDDSRLTVEDETHPVVYPAAGAHATFYTNNVYLAWGENGSGFGCDFSSPPSVRTPLDVVLMPNDPDPNGEFAWLLWEGRWGERQPNMFNGPLGPTFNSRWAEPWETTDRWRTYSIVVPEANNALGPTMTDTFCTVVEAGSRLLIYTVVYPWVAIPGVAIVAGAFWFFYRRSRDLFHRSIRLYRAHWKVFVGIGLIAIPIGIAFNVVQAFLVRHDPLRYMLSWFDDTAGARLSTVTAFGSLQQIAMLLIIGPAVIQAVADIHRGLRPSITRSYRIAATRALPIAMATLIMLVLAGIPLLIIIGIPVAIWLVVKWQFFAHILVFETDRSSVEALDESAALVKGRWWKTLFAVIIFDLLATIPGIVVGFGLLALAGTAADFANSISSVLYALLIPLSVIAVTLMYLDRRGESLPDPSPVSESPAPEAQTAPV